jgi:hypothetical protein
MKKIIVEVADGTKAELVETVPIKHLSDLGEGVKDVVEDFVKMNEGVVFPPVSIQVTEQKTDGPKEANTGAV